MKRLTIIVMSMVLAASGNAQQLPGLGMDIKEVYAPSAEGGSTQEYHLAITLRNNSSARLVDVKVRYAVRGSIPGGNGTSSSEKSIEDMDPKSSQTLETKPVKINKSFTSRRDMVPGVFTSIRGYGAQVLVNGKIASEFLGGTLTKKEMEVAFERLKFHKAAADRKKKQ
ncbi:MAG: hypothetical protein NTY01_00300 [Verrucomicrobia bacterium]|nr:hypothetical protein [Verrucomicrobiota bacterium]